MGGELLIVGQAPGRRGIGPGGPLAGDAARKLAGALEEAFLLVERTNVLSEFPGRAGQKGDAFPAREARAAADEISLQGRRAVLLGRKVAAAFGLPNLPWFEWREHRGGMVAVSPHPSGVSRWWNDSENRERAERFWSAFLGASRPVVRGCTEATP